MLQIHSTIHSVIRAMKFQLDIVLYDHSFSYIMKLPLINATDSLYDSTLCSREAMGSLSTAKPLDYRNCRLQGMEILFFFFRNNIAISYLMHLNQVQSVGLLCWSINYEADQTSSLKTSRGGLLCLGHVIVFMFLLQKVTARFLIYYFRNIFVEMFELWGKMDVFVR